MAAPAKSRPADPAQIVAAARKKPQPIYLLIGEPFRTGALARELIDALVPAERRSFNVETYEGRAQRLGPVLDSLRMHGMFGGTKVIWVREITLFISGEKRSDLATAMRRAWTEERPGDAAEKLLILAALAGWSQSRFAETEWRSLSRADGEDLLGQPADEEMREMLHQLADHCRERGLTVGEHRDEAGLLEQALSAGLPADSVLVLTASEVDRRKRILKKVAAHGVVASLTLERERSGSLSADSVRELIHETVARHGKKLAPAAERELQQRAGADAALLRSEIEKLCLYAGDAAEIDAGAVRASVRDMSESWIFDFTGALAKRDAAESIRLLRGLFAQGEHPLRLLAMIAREIRMLLLARDCLTGSLSGKWSSRTTYATFRDRLLPALSENEKEALGRVHPYPLYLALQNSARVRGATLQRAMLGVQELDIKMKSSVGDPRLLLESFVLDLCRR